MDLTRGSTYVRTSSQSLLGKTREFSEDLRSEVNDQVEPYVTQKDAGGRKLSSTAPWSQQSDPTPPFASRSTEVRMEFNSWLKSLQVINDGIEDDEQTEDSELNLESIIRRSQFRDKYSVINEPRDRNGTTRESIDNHYSGVSILGDALSESEEEYSLTDRTETSEVNSQNHMRNEETLQIRQLPISEKPVIDNRLSTFKPKLQSIPRHQWQPFSQADTDVLEIENNLLDNKASDSRTLYGSPNARNKNSHVTDNTRLRDDKPGHTDIFSKNDNDGYQYEQNKYQNSENKSREDEPQVSSTSRIQYKESSVSGLDMTMREEDLERSERGHLTHRQVPINTSRTTGEVNTNRTRFQGGPQTISSREFSSLRPMSSQGKGSILPMQREREQKYLEETNTKSSNLTDARTLDRGSHIRKEKSRYLTSDGLVPTSTSEAFQWFAKAQIVSLREHTDLLNASMTQRKIRNKNDLNQAVEEEKYLRALNHFGLTSIVEPPRDDSLVEILDIRSIQLHASNMIFTSEIYSEHKSLYNRTQISELQATTFNTLMDRAEKVKNLLEIGIATCTNKYRINLFDYLSEILDEHNQYGVQVMTSLPKDWELFSLKLQRYFLILAKEKHFAEAIRMLSDLNNSQEAEIVSLLESEELIQDHIEEEVEQYDDLSVSSEAAMEYYAELTNQNTHMNQPGRKVTGYNTKFTNNNSWPTKGQPKSPHQTIKQVRTPERNYHEYRDNGSPINRGMSPLIPESSKTDGIPPIIELLDPQRVSYDTDVLDELDDNFSRTSSNVLTGLPSRDKVGVIFSKNTLYAKRDAIVLELQLKMGFSEHQREAMLSGGIGSTTLNNLDWKCRLSQFRNYQYCVNLYYIQGSDKLDYERFLNDTAMKARHLKLSTKELCLLFKETGMGPAKETAQSYLWANKYPTIVNRVLSKTNWELGTETAEEWLYWEILWNKIRIEIVSLGIAKKNDNTLAERLEKVYFVRDINLESPHDIENLDKLIIWIDKLTAIYRTSNQSKVGYSYLWFFILRKLSAVNCTYIMVWITYLKSQMNKAMTLMNLTTHDRQRLFGTTEGVEREEDNLQKDDFEWAIECLRTAHMNSQLDYSLSVAIIKTQQSNNKEKFKSTPPPPPITQSRKGRNVSSVAPQKDHKFDMFDGKDSKSYSQVERNLRQETYLLTHSIPILNMLKEKTPEAIAKAPKFREFLLKNNLTTCSCGLLKEVPQCNEHCVIMVNKEFKVGNFVQFLKNKSQRLGHKFEEKEVLVHLQYLQRNAKWDEAKLQTHLKSTMEKWASVSLSTTAVAKVLNVLNTVGINQTQLATEEEEYDVSYSETDSSQF